MDTRAFFDRHAPLWDSYQTPQTHAAIVRILERAALPPGARVLDVGAGTGILYPYLREGGAAAYTAIDISPEMIRRLRAAHPGAEAVVADFQEPMSFPAPFDAVMIFNAFPHFRDEEAVFLRARDCLAPGGRLFICHSLNREGLREHHRQAGSDVAGDVLIPDERMAALYAGAGFAAIQVENSDIFYSEGTR
jgi:demethylmenaquinone methyltransferase/2-methoxy-6-polyprenyl-1,4-benzoquinol methylase